MSKSLTDVAKSILMKENAGIPEVRPEDNGSPFRDADASNVNSATLKPGSKSVDGVNANPGAPGADQFQKKQDLGPALTKNTDVPGSAKAVVGGKDSSKAAKATVAGEAPKKLSEEEEVDEDVEISEELEAFIDAMIAEGASEEDIAAAIEENFELVSESDDKDEDDKEDDEDDKEEDDKEDKKEIDEGTGGGKAPKPVKKSDADAIAAFKGKITKVAPVTDKSGKMKMAAEEVDMSEDLNALFSGEELSEDFKAKAKTIFESAVKLKVEQENASLAEAYETKLEEEVAAIKEELSNNVDDYLNYVVEQWTSENEVAIEAGLRSELTEDFISGLRNLFAEHYIDIPEDKVNMIEEMGAKVEELEAKLNEEIERSVVLTKMLNESHTNEILISACEGLTDTQAEKLKSLAEGIEYADAKEFATKITTLKESYFTNNVKSENVLDKAESVSDGKSMISEDLTGPMAKYVQTLGRTTFSK